MIVNCAPPDVPPPGDGVATITIAVPVVVSSTAGSTAVSSLADTYVVCKGVLSKVTTDCVVNPVPKTSICVSDDPAATEAGEILERVGDGLTSERLAVPDLLLSVWLTAEIVTDVPPVGNELGAVYNPCVDTVPVESLPPATPFTSQFTAWLKSPLPWTVAVH